MFHGAAIADNVVLKQKQLRASYHRVRKQDNSALMQRIHRRVYEVRLGDIQATTLQATTIQVSKITGLNFHDLSGQYLLLVPREFEFSPSFQSFIDSLRLSLLS
jgi:hypothetical protein